MQIRFKQDLETTFDLDPDLGNGNGIDSPNNNIDSPKFFIPNPTPIDKATNFNPRDSLKFNNPEMNCHKIINTKDKQIQKEKENPFKKPNLPLQYKTINYFMGEYEYKNRLSDIKSSQKI